METASSTRGVVVTGLGVVPDRAQRGRILGGPRRRPMRDQAGDAVRSRRVRQPDWGRGARLGSRPAHGPQGGAAERPLHPLRFRGGTAGGGRFGVGDGEGGWRPRRRHHRLRHRRHAHLRDPAQGARRAGTAAGVALHDSRPDRQHVRRARGDRVWRDRLRHRVACATGTHALGGRRTPSGGRCRHRDRRWRRSGDRHLSRASAR